MMRKVIRTVFVFLTLALILIVNGNVIAEDLPWKSYNEQGRKEDVKTSLNIPEPLPVWDGIYLIQGSEYVELSDKNAIKENNWYLIGKGNPELHANAKVFKPLYTNTTDEPVRILLKGIDPEGVMITLVSIRFSKGLLIVPDTYAIDKVIDRVVQEMDIKKATLSPGVYLLAVKAKLIPDVYKYYRRDIKFGLLITKTNDVSRKFRDFRDIAARSDGWILLFEKEPAAFGN